MITWILLLLYLLSQLGIGFYVSRKVKSDKDYFLAGRSLGVNFAAISIFATWFGAETCIGSSAAIFESGLSGSRADPFGYTICLFLAAMFLASQLWRLNITTLGDFYRIRYSGSVEKLAAIVIVPSSLIWAAAQIKAFGHILSVATNADPTLTTALATVFVIAYTSMGGLLADVITDVVQGGILLLGLILILIFSIDKIGGLSAAFSAIDPARLSFISPDEPLLAQIDTWMIPILGSVVAQEMISRTLAVKSSKLAKKATFMASGIYLFVGMIPVIIGLIGYKLIHVQLTDPEQFLPQIAEEVLPYGLFIIFSGAVISAILSTIDSSLLAISAFSTHNLMGERFYKLKPMNQVWTARIVIVAAGLIAYAITFTGTGIYELVENASAFGAPGVLAITFGGLYFHKKGGKYSALAALIYGTVIIPIFEHLGFTAPFITGVLTTVALYACCAMFEKGRVPHPVQV